MLGRAVGHALQPAQLLRGLLLDLFGHAGSGDGFPEFGDLGRIALVLAELALDLGHLLAQQMLALAVAELLLHALADLGRQAQHLEPLGEQRHDLVEARLQRDRLQYVLLLVGADIEIGRRQVGQRAGRRDRADRVGQALRRLRQQPHRLQRLVAQVDEARLDLVALGCGLLDALDPGDEERPAVEEFDDAEACLALDDQVMGLVGPGDVAQHIGDGAHAVHVERTGLLGVGVALGEHADGAALANRRLRRVDRHRPADRQRHHHLGEHHEVADRHDDHRVGGKFGQAGTGVGPCLLRLDRLAVGQVGHRRSPPFTLFNVTSRHPCTLDRRTES